MVLINHSSYFMTISNNRSLTKSKHIDIKFLVIKEKVKNSKLSREHIETNSMVADLLTKKLPLKIFNEYTAGMNVMSLVNIQF